MIDAETFRDRVDELRDDYKRDREHLAELEKELHALCILTGMSIEVQNTSSQYSGYPWVQANRLALYDEKRELIAEGPAWELIHQLVRPEPADDAPFGIFQDMHLTADPGSFAGFNPFARTTPGAAGPPPVLVFTVQR